MISPRAIAAFCCAAGALTLAAGCGTTKSQVATEQLLMSDAVDRAVSTLDFRPFAGERVYLDTSYVQTGRPGPFSNTEYAISSIRQQLAGANCLLQENAKDADYVIEMRMGALGTNGHSLIYGLPANNVLGSATSVLPGAPAMPSIPEISLARREDTTGAAKIGLFAYHRESRQPVWQSGIAQARSSANATWLLGIGPFQRGTIYDGTRFAGSDLSLPLVKKEEDAVVPAGMVSYDEEYFFRPLEPETSNGETAATATPGEIVEPAEYQPSPIATGERPKRATGSDPP